MARATAWFAVTSAPGVTAERPMRPAIGERTRVKFRSMPALSRAARAAASSASAFCASARASSLACLLTASFFSSPA